MLRHPWELDTDVRHRIDAIAELYQRGRPLPSAAATHPRPWVRVRRGLGHGLIAAGLRLAGDPPVTHQPNPAAGHAG